jgi:hypothetical protein
MPSMLLSTMEAPAINFVFFTHYLATYQKIGESQANLSGYVSGVSVYSGELCRVISLAVQPAATFVELALKSVAVGGVSVVCGLFHIFILDVF